MIKINKKILCGILSLTMIFSLAACSNKDNTETGEDITTHVSSSREILKNLVSSTDREMDNLLNIDSLDKYSEVGALNGEVLYALHSTTYTNLVRRFMERMEPNVLEQELVMRGFYTASNNILFTTNSQFLNRNKILASDFTYYQEIEEETVFQKVPDLEDKVKEFEKRGFSEMSFFRVVHTSAEKNDEISSENYYEVIYLLGKDTSGYKILDAYYFLNHSNLYNVKKPYLDIAGIENFSPLIIENKKVINRENLAETFVEEKQEQQEVEKIEE